MRLSDMPWILKTSTTFLVILLFLVVCHPLPTIGQETQLFIGNTIYVNVSLPFENVTSFSYNVTDFAGTPLLITVTDADQACPHIWIIEAVNSSNVAQKFTNNGTTINLAGNLASSTILRTLPLPASGFVTNWSITITPTANWCDNATTPVVGLYVDAQIAGPAFATPVFPFPFGQRRFFLSSPNPGPVDIRVEQCQITDQDNATYTMALRWGYFQPFPTDYKYVDTVAIPYNNGLLYSMWDFAAIGYGNSELPVHAFFDTNTYHDFLFYVEWEPFFYVRGKISDAPIVENSTTQFVASFASVVDESTIGLTPLINGDDLVIITYGGYWLTNSSKDPEDYAIFATCSKDAVAFSEANHFALHSVFGSYCYMQTNTSSQLFKVDVPPEDISITSPTKSTFTLKKFFTNCATPKTSNTTAILLAVFDMKNQVRYGSVLEFVPSDLSPIVPVTNSEVSMWAATPAILLYVTLAVVIGAFIVIIILLRRGSRKDGYEPVH